MRSLIRGYRRTLQSDRRHPARASSRRAHRPQGRRRRQRRHPGVDRAAARPRRRRPAVPAGQGGARPRCSSEFVGRAEYDQPRRARRARPAPDAGQQRHLPRLAARRPGSTASHRDFYVRQLRDWKGSAVVETMIPAGMAALRRHVRRDAGPGPRPLRRPRRDRLLPRRQRRASTGRSPSSPRPTPTRTSATTPPSCTPWRRGGLKLPTSSAAVSCSRTGSSLATADALGNCLTAPSTCTLLTATSPLLSVSVPPERRHTGIVVKPAPRFSTMASKRAGMSRLGILE